MTRFTFIILFLFLINIISLPQVSETPVAIINNQAITSDEFKLRFELSPYISQKYDNYQIDSLKMDFLYSLIAEKIWSIEAEKKGFAQSNRFNFFFQPVEEILLRDALFKKEIENKLVLSPEDITKGIQKYSTTILTEIITSADSTIVNKVYNDLLNSPNPDSLINNSISIKNLSVEKEINLGTLNDESLEDSIYSLSPGEFTKPFKHESVWVIFFVKNKLRSSLVNLTDQKTNNEIKRTIKNRRVQKKYIEYLRNLLSGKTFSINEKSFFFIADKIVNVIKSKPENEQNIYLLSEGEYFNILTQLTNDELKKELFFTDNNPFTIFEFLSNLSFDQFSVSSQDKNKILIKLNKQIKVYIEQQVLTNEALNHGLTQLPEVQNDFETWKENYLSHMYRVSFYDSVKVSNEDVYNYYLNKIKSEGFNLINLALITTNDLDIIAKILDQLKLGREFTDIAVEFGKTDSLVNEKGITGLTPSVLLGDLGNIAADLKENEIYGPMKRENYYSVFQMLEKQISNDTLKLSFENAKSGLHNELINNELNRLLTQKTVQFISNNQVKIFPEIVKEVNVSGIQMFVHRLMGFGGKIASVPLTNPFSDWINELELNKLLP
jgi:parvulin-like peptidyl-prolyl isomerase